MVLKDVLAPQSQKDLLTVLKDFYKCACYEYGIKFEAELFEDLNTFIPEDPADKGLDEFGNPIFVWRFADAMKIIKNIHPRFKNVTKLYFLTGMSASEIAGITRQSIQGDVLMVRTFISNNRRRDRGKNKYRTRRFKITKAIKSCLDEALLTAKDDRLFISATGLNYSCKRFYGPWETSIKRSGLTFTKPYSTRHTFAAWSLATRITPLQLSNLMGHGSKEQVYETYGDWTYGLEEDFEDIRAFFGEDYYGN